jgi:hypothetical protein
MDFDEWERMKEYEQGRGAYQGLYDAVGKTVSSAYGDMVPCPKCGKITNTFKDFSGKCCCQHCAHVWYG